MTHHAEVNEPSPTEPHTPDAVPGEREPAEREPAQHGAPRVADRDDDALSGQVVVRDRGSTGGVPAAWSARVAELRQRLPELARHPAVVATATVGTGIAVSLVREVVRGAAARSAPAPTTTNVSVVNHVHVVHHVVHHVVTHAAGHVTGRPSTPPGPPPGT